MSSALSLADIDNLDETMRAIARHIAMGIYPLEQILSNLEIKPHTFNQWKNNPRFLKYLQSESEAWHAAGNVAERTKLKAGIIMEEWMINAHGDLNDKKQPLNHRVELGKLIAKVAGMGEPKVGAQNQPGNGFQLQINIGPGVAPVSINAVRVQRTVEHEEGVYDPFQSPNTLDD